MSQESGASGLEMGPSSFSVGLADTDDENDRCLDALCESLKRAREYRKTTGFYNGVASRQYHVIEMVAPGTPPLTGRVFAAAEEAACLDADQTVISD